MNERVKELIKQADLGWTIQRANIQGDNKDLERLNKFAELIVRECIWIIDNDGTSEDITEFFGVNNE
jgi:hypothetical protein